MEKSMATSKVSTNLPKWTSLEDLEKTNIGPVWALNNTSTAGDSGNLLMSIPKVNGNGYDLVRVYKSFIPFDLTLQVPRAQLIASAEFRNAVSKKHIRLLSPEYAKAILSTEDGAEEAARIENLVAKVTAASNAAGVSEDEDDTFNPAEMGKAPSAKVAEHKEEVKEKEVKKVATEASIQITTLANTATTESWTAVAIRNALRNYGLEKLTKADFKFLAKKFKGKPKVLTFLEEAYQKTKA